MSNISTDCAWRWNGYQWVPIAPTPPSGTAPIPPGPSNSYQQPYQRGPLSAAEEVNAASWSHYGPLIAVAVCTVLWLSVVGWALAWLGIFVFAIPLVIRQVQGQRSRFVMHHSTESLNFQLTCLLVSFVAVIIACTVLAIMAIPAILTLGLAYALLGLLAAGLAIAYTIFVIVVMAKAGNAAKRGESYRYPLTIRFVTAG